MQLCQEGSWNLLISFNSTKHRTGESGKVEHQSMFTRCLCRTLTVSSLFLNDRCINQPIRALSVIGNPGSRASDCQTNVMSNLILSRIYRSACSYFRHSRPSVRSRQHLRQQPIGVSTFKRSMTFSTYSNQHGAITKLLFQGRHGNVHSSPIVGFVE